jgi:hypothetical protein
MTPFQTYRTAAAAAVFTLLATILLQPVHAQTVPASNPVAGTWSWTLFDGKCTETLQYRADGVLLNTSGDAVTEWRYTASNAADARGFYKLSEISTRYNSKKDCYGDTVDEIGLKTTQFIQFSPANDLLIVCKSASLKACYGPLKRLP